MVDRKINGIAQSELLEIRSTGTLASGEKAEFQYLDRETRDRPHSSDRTYSNLKEACRILYGFQIPKVKFRC